MHIRYIQCKKKHRKRCSFRVVRAVPLRAVSMQVLGTIDAQFGPLLAGAAVLLAKMLLLIVVVVGCWLLLLLLLLVVVLVVGGGGVHSVHSVDVSGSGAGGGSCVCGGGPLRLVLVIAPKHTDPRTLPAARWRWHIWKVGHKETLKTASYSKSKLQSRGNFTTTTAHNGDDTRIMTQRCQNDAQITQKWPRKVQK